MGLVDYSDSDDSDNDQSDPAPASVPSSTATKHPQKFIDRSEPRKIKVDLPSVKPEPAQQDDAPPAKRARTAGAFSGFNSLLPAPKKPAQQNAPKAGVSLKTSSEAAFSRAPAPVLENGDGEDEEDDSVGLAGAPPETVKLDGEREEPKIVGKATRFKPLSVSNQKKKPAKKKDVTAMEGSNGGPNDQGVIGLNKKEDADGKGAVEAIVPPKPKRSLFSVPQHEDDTNTPAKTGTYEAITTESFSATDTTSGHVDQPNTTQPAPSNSDSLQSLASDLNLTPAQRRQLFGRNTKNSDVNISHFNMDAEYAYNNQLREAGEVIEHRAVKSIAPGKHSLQQLVNNARTQQDAMEDKWADGRRERGEGGSKYGWGGAR